VKSLKDSKKHFQHSPQKWDFLVKVPAFYLETKSYLCDNKMKYEVFMAMNIRMSSGK
jgi:hypothetical protein